MGSVFAKLEGFAPVELQKEKPSMETLWMIATVVVVSLIAAAFRTRKTSSRNLGYVSRDWVIRHNTD